MGGSYGGYLANWIAGHTDRFRAIVTHASLWDLTQFAGTTDSAYYWTREMTPEMSAASSPSAHADAISTPMLVVHGDEDDRVPVGEALRLWWDLVSRSEDVELPHRFLLFPDEDHWVLKPQNAQTWYDTVFAFLAWHVLGQEWVAPDVLRLAGVEHLVGLGQPARRAARARRPCAPGARAAPPPPSGRASAPGCRAPSTPAPWPRTRP